MDRRTAETDKRTAETDRRTVETDRKTAETDRRTSELCVCWFPVFVCRVVCVWVSHTIGRIKRI